MDYLMKTMREDIFRFLINCILDTMIHKDINICEIMVTRGSKIENYLKKSGFINLNRKFFIMLNENKEEYNKKINELKADKIHLSFGDIFTR